MFIELTAVGKTYPIEKGKTCQALKNVSLSIEQGEITAIVGKSGAGKSTLLHILGAMESPTCGEYTLNGIHIESCNDSQLAQLRNRSMGFVLQEFALINDLTVAENVLLPAYFHNEPLRTSRKRVNTLLELVGIQALHSKRACEKKSVKR